ncbi:lambda exonuclease family protein [Serratia oryzae]|uniref:lambda exonuclease family protein n=1 Tax=Serratia oryzae TaxID=2034155 RepID=UPI0012E16DE5|nr:lambda exonuclease family protein [Serratia oryzae]
MNDIDLILQRTGVDLTNLQQGSGDWRRLRLGVITASNAVNLLAAGRGGKGWGEKKKTYLLDLVAEVCTGQSPEVTSRPMEWGKGYEDDARYAFSFVTDLGIEEVPFIYKDDSLRCGASPDGICSDGAGLELKCPYNTSVYLDFRLNGEIKPEYIAQCQFSMWVTGRERWYFANYDPRMKVEGLHYITIDRDQKVMKALDEQVPEFIEAMDAALADLGVTFGEQWQC